MEVWIKRDDETGLVTSGNKIRKLQFLLADAIDKEHDCIVTIGTFTSCRHACLRLTDSSHVGGATCLQVGGNRITAARRRPQRASWESSATSS